MGFEFNGGTLYMMEPNGEQFKLGDVSYGDIEADTSSPNETPDIIYNFKNVANTSLEALVQDISWLDDLAYRQFTPTKSWIIEYDVPILAQARWHKKKRINKKWLKRFGMKSDTVTMKSVARNLTYNTQTGEFNCEVDKLDYLWRPDQLRKNLKIEM